MKLVKFSVCAAALALAGCGNGSAQKADANAVAAQADGVPASEAVDPASTGMTASARLKTAKGIDAGSATAVAVDGAINVSLAIKGLTPGDHGAHIHMTGRCDPPAFESAGAHWNPAGAKHGLSNPQGTHSGDMPNLTVATDGTGKMDYAIKGGNIEELFDADGSAIVIHAKPDDQMTDPSGNSGDRVACGVFLKD